MLSLEYIAGVFDSEGWVTISEYRPKKEGSIHHRFNLSLGISMCHRPIIERICKEFGGNVFIHPRPNPKHRTVYAWMLGSVSAANFLRLIGPQLIVKQDEAQVALDFQANINLWRHRLGNQYKQHPKRQEVMAYRAELKRKLFELKHVRYDS